MKKRTIAILVGMMCLTATSSYAQKNLVKGLTEALSSKTTSAVSAQVERQVARATLEAHTIPYASAANIPTATAVLSLERVKAEALHPQMDISKLVPVRPTNRADLVNRSLLRVQQSIQQDGEIPTGYRYLPDVKVTWLAYHRLLLEDRKGNLSPEEQIQLRSLFWHTNPSISSVERKLQSWQDRYGADPMLPNQEDLDYLSGVTKPPYGNAFEEWTLAANIYMLQKLYGTALPKRIRNVQLIPVKENQKEISSHKKGLAILQKNQEKFAQARAQNEYETAWETFIKEQKTLTSQEGTKLYEDGTDVAKSVYDFYVKHIGIENLPRVKDVDSPDKEFIVCEIPVDGLKFVGLLGNTLDVIPEGVVVLGSEQDSHLVFREWFTGNETIGKPFYRVVK